MRKLFKRRGIVIAGLAVLAVALLLFSRGGDNTSAHGHQNVPPTPFVMDYTVALDNTGGLFPYYFGANSGPAGAPQFVTQFGSQNIFDITGAFPPLFTSRVGGNLPSSGIMFTPADWTVVPGAALPIGMTVAGSFTGITLGFVNGPCLTSVPVAGPGLNATTDSADIIVVEPNFVNLIVDVDPVNGVPDGADHFPDIVAAAIPPAVVGDPYQRSYFQWPDFLGTTTHVTADVLTYAPDQLVPLGIPSGLGWATVVIVENFNSALDPTPSLITDQCGWEASLLSFGGLRYNPATPGTKVFYALAESRLDADNDGFDNDQDRCPYTPDVPMPGAYVGLPMIPSLNMPLDSNMNGIPDSCDPGPPYLNPSDGDLDSFPNAQDNCALVSNILQDQTEPDTLSVPSPIGPSADAIGDACDVNPAVADGSFHHALDATFICITGGGETDTDGDGVCDSTEDSLGSDKNAATSVPEDLSIIGQCANGADDDGDGLIDLADPDCQLPMHDLALKKVTGAKNICPDSNVSNHVIQLRNDTGAPETAEIGISVDSVIGTGGSGAEVTSVSGATVTSSRALNVDGDTDLEWETKATVDLKATGTTVVTFKVTYPACGAGPDASAFDYTLSVDLCHGDDIPPLALFGASSPVTCGATADGGQDRNPANDGPVSVVVNDLTK